MGKGRRQVRVMSRAEYEESIRRLARCDGFTTRDVTGLLAALDEALLSEVPFAKVGCSVMCQGAVVSVGRNSLKTDPLQRKWNKYRTFDYLTPSDPSNMDSIHAEIAALKAIPYPVDRQLKWRHARIYVFRLAPGLPLGQGMSRPCPACWNAIADKGARQVVYSTREGFAKEQLLRHGI